MKVSEITVDTLKEWLGVSDGEDSALSMVLSAAVKTAASYSGLTEAELDEHEDITIAVLGICNDFYNANRPEWDKNGINRMSESLLKMHAKNYL